MTTMGIIFANIYDSSLGELTNKRTMASLPYGGRYRQIDFSLSNMTNSAIRHIGIITKYNYQSLMNHIGSGQEWDLELGEGGLEFLTPFAMGHNGSYRGKLEALDSAMNFLKISTEEYVVLADSGVLCAINLEKIVEAHAASGADVTVVVKDGICNGKKQLDLAVKVDADDRVTDVAVDYCAGEQYLASMGLFVIRRELLMREVTEAVAHNRYHFERDLVMHGFAETGMKVNAYRYDGVALFNESTTEFFHNSLALIRPEIRHGLFARDLTIYTKVRDEVPACYGSIPRSTTASWPTAACSRARRQFRPVPQREARRGRIRAQQRHHARCTIGEGADLGASLWIWTSSSVRAPCCAAPWIIRWCSREERSYEDRNGRLRGCAVCQDGRPGRRDAGASQCTVQAEGQRDLPVPAVL
ncbi:MAG: sugar phosphate nucleotidyltransferase [Oscillospiraceae bacterium]